MAKEKPKNPAPLKDIFLLYYVPHSDSVFMDDPLTFHKQLEGIKKEGTHIHLILHTLGGDPYSAAKIIYILHQQCEKLTAVIPYWAMSAGTLISLGANEIVMFDTAQLGPLDMQIQHPLVERQISAYDYYASASYISGVVNAAASRFYKKVREDGRSKVNAEKAMNIAYENAVGLFSPLIEKLDPVELNKCYRILDVSSKYGMEFLMKYSLKEDFKEVKYAERLIGHLTYGYPDHSFGIFRDEMSDYGLNIKSDKEYTHSQEVWKFVETYLMSDVDLRAKSVGKIIKKIDLGDR